MSELQAAPQTVHSEIVRRIAERERLSVATSCLAFGLQALTGRGYAADRNLLRCLLLMVLLEPGNGVIASRLQRHEASPVKVDRALKFLVLGLFLAAVPRQGRWAQPRLRLTCI